MSGAELTWAEWLAMTAAASTASTVTALAVRRLLTHGSRR